MNSKFNVEGKILLEGSRHSVEYEPSGMTGLSTLYLKVLDGTHVVPIYVNQIEEVIDMLVAGRDLIRISEQVGKQ